MKICAFRARALFLGQPSSTTVVWMLPAVVGGREVKADFQKKIKNS